MAWIGLLKNRTSGMHHAWLRELKSQILAEVASGGSIELVDLKELPTDEAAADALISEFVARERKLSGTARIPTRDYQIKRPKGRARQG